MLNYVQHLFLPHRKIWEIQIADRKLSFSFPSGSMIYALIVKPGKADMQNPERSKILHSKDLALHLAKYFLSIVRFTLQKRLSYTFILIA